MHAGAPQLDEICFWAGNEHTDGDEQILAGTVVSVLPDFWLCHDLSTPREFTETFDSRFTVTGPDGYRAGRVVTPVRGRRLAGIADGDPLLVVWRQ